MNASATMSAENTLREMCEIFENMPEERQAYLNGYVAGMNAERALSAQQKPA